MSRLLDEVTAWTAQERAVQWTGTWAEYLEIVKAQPRVARSSHARLADLIREAGVQDGPDGPQYAFFADHIYGAEKALRLLMEYLDGAARRLDVRKRVLLLIGPPGGGKSSLVIRLKRALEAYTRTDAGAVYGIATCPLHEDPLHVIPAPLRAQAAADLGIPPIEGDLCPVCALAWQTTWQHEVTQVPVTRVLFSERDRVGIGTFAPADPKDLDISQLVGGLDFSKIAEFGSESDPRAYRFDGEFMVANRGIIEFQEYLKIGKEFQYHVLSLAQEANVKLPRYGLLSVDEVIVAHSNIWEFDRFLGSAEHEAMKNRVYLVQVPYALRVQDEVRIYQSMLREGGTDIGHLAPPVLGLAAWFAVLSRLEPAQDPSLHLLDKLRLYNGEAVQEIQEHEVRTLHAQHPREGLTGLSPRDAMNVLAHARGFTHVPCVTPVDYLRAVKAFVEEQRFLVMPGADAQKRLTDLLTLTRTEYDRQVKETVMRAFVHAFDAAAQTLFDAYLQQAEATLDKQQVPDPLTGELRDPDRKYLREIEEHIGVGEQAATPFREEMVRKAGSAARRGETFRWDSHPRLREGIERRLFADVRVLVKGTLGTKTPDPEQQERLDQVVQHLITEEGYCDHCAPALIAYAGDLLKREGQ